MPNCSKKTQFRAYCIPMYAYQLWSKYTHTCEALTSSQQQCLPNYVYIPRYMLPPTPIMSGPLTLCLEIICMASFADANLIKFFCPITSIVWCVSQIFIFPPSFNVFFLTVTNYSSCWCVLVSVFLQRASWCLIIFAFSCDSSHPHHVEDVSKPNT